MSGHDGTDTPGSSECTAEGAGHGTVAVVTIIEITREIILGVINLFYVILTIPWEGAIVIIPVLEIRDTEAQKG